MYKLFLFIVLVAFQPPGTIGQTYDIVIKNGTVIDPRNNINGLMDVAISDGKIVSVANGISSVSARQVVDAKGLIVIPGIIDMHSHNFPEVRKGDPFPDLYTFRSGVTTTVDAGSSGWRTFADFKRETIDHSQTRVLAFLNIVGSGFKNPVNEQNTGDMDAKLTAIAAKRYKDYVVGIKVAHFEGPEWTPVDRAVDAAGKVGNIPVMIDFGGSIPPCLLKIYSVNTFDPVIFSLIVSDSCQAGKQLWI